MLHLCIRFNSNFFRIKKQKLTWIKNNLEKTVYNAIQILVRCLSLCHVMSSLSSWPGLASATLLLPLSMASCCCCCVIATIIGGLYTGPCIPMEFIRLHQTSPDFIRLYQTPLKSIGVHWSPLESSLAPVGAGEDLVRSPIGLHATGLQWTPTSLLKSKQLH